MSSVFIWLFNHSHSFLCITLIQNHYKIECGLQYVLNWHNFSTITTSKPFQHDAPWCFCFALLSVVLNSPQCRWSRARAVAVQGAETTPISTFRSMRSLPNSPFDIFVGLIKPNWRYVYNLASLKYLVVDKIPYKRPSVTERSENHNSIWQSQCYLAQGFHSFVIPTTPE